MLKWFGFQLSVNDYIRVLIVYGDTGAEIRKRSDQITLTFLS